MRVRVKNGTPIFGASLCESCTQALIVKGYRESEEIVVCEATYPRWRVTFPVRECSSHRHKNRQDLEEMEKIAWVLPARGSNRRAGFVPAEKLRKKEGEGLELILSEEE
jgi:hypothetical protein